MDPDLSPASVEDLRAALDQQVHQLETRVEELRGVLRSNRRRSIKDYWRGRVPDLQLRWTAIRGAINVVNYAPSGLWSVRVRESEKVLLEAWDVIGEVQRYWVKLLNQATCWPRTTFPLSPICEIPFLVRPARPK